MKLKRQVFNQCILPTLTYYGCQTWTLTKDIIQKNGNLPKKNGKKNARNKIPNLEIREKTKVNDIIEEITILKWKWAGHVARMKDNRWTIRCTEWQVRDGKRSRGRPKRR